MDNPQRDLIQAALRAAENQRRQIERMDIIPCGDVRLDELARLICEARKKTVLQKPAIEVIEALSCAMDIVSQMQTEVIEKKIFNNN